MPAAGERSLAHPVPKQYRVAVPESTSRGRVLLLTLVTLAGAWLRLFHLGTFHATTFVSGRGQTQTSRLASGAGVTTTSEASDDGPFEPRNSLRLWLVVALGAVLRLVALGHKSFWLDEITSVAIVQQPSAAFWHFLWHEEGNMAMYYVLLRPWLHFGNSEAIIRLLSVLPGVLSIPLMYLLGKRLFGPRAGILTAALFALNPCAIASSQEARAYSFLVLMVIISTYCFIRLMEGPSYKFAIVYGLAAGFTYYFHYFGVLVAAAHAVSLVAMPRGKWPWKQYSVAGVILVFLAIPIFWLIHAQNVRHISWVRPPSLLEFYHLGAFLAANGGKAVGAVLLALNLVIVGLYLGKLRTEWRERDNDLQRWRHALVASSFFSPIVLTLLVSIVRPVFYHRFLIICLPAWVLMTAVGARQIRHRLWRTLAVGGVCVLSFVSTVISYTRVAEDWRGATNVILSSAQSGDAVVIYPFYAITGFDYYRQRNPHAPALHLFTQPYYGVGDNDETLLQALSPDSRGFRHVWVMVRREGPARDDLQDDSPAVAAKLQSVFGTPAVWQFKDITVLEFGR
jgi:4-amino-4-deoxy-L-arabinose transferase-like glycosyltransferase